MSKHVHVNPDLFKNFKHDTIVDAVNHFSGITNTDLTVYVESAEIKSQIREITNAWGSCVKGPKGTRFVVAVETSKGTFYRKYLSV